MLIGLIGLNQGCPPPKEQGMQVARNQPHHNTKNNDLPVCRHPLLRQMKVIAHLTLHLPHLPRQLPTVLPTAPAIIPHRQWTKDSQTSTLNADLPVLHMQKKGHQTFRTPNMAAITINGKDSTDPANYHRPHHHPALALMTTPLSARAHVMPMVGYQPHTHYPPSLKNS